MDIRSRLAAGNLKKELISYERQRTELAEYHADYRIEIGTLCAPAIDLIKNAAPSVVREAGRVVEIRSYNGRVK